MIITGTLGRAVADGQAARTVAGARGASLPSRLSAKRVRRRRQCLGVPPAVRHPDALEEVPYLLQRHTHLVKVLPSGWMLVFSMGCGWRVSARCCQACVLCVWRGESGVLKCECGVYICTSAITHNQHCLCSTVPPPVVFMYVSLLFASPFMAMHL